MHLPVLLGKITSPLLNEKQLCFSHTFPFPSQMMTKLAKCLRSQLVQRNFLRTIICIRMDCRICSVARSVALVFKSLVFHRPKIIVKRRWTKRSVFQPVSFSLFLFSRRADPIERKSIRFGGVGQSTCRCCWNDDKCCRTLRCDNNAFGWRETSRRLFLRYDWCLATYRSLSKCLFVNVTRAEVAADVGGVAREFSTSSGLDHWSEQWNDQ